MQNTSIYEPEVVRAIREFYGPLLDKAKFNGQIREHLNLLAERLYEGIKIGHGGILTEVNNYHPEFLGTPISELKQKQLTMDAARQTIASEYGFKDWQEIQRLDLTYNTEFETTVFKILEGDLQGVRKRIKAQPDLLKARSHCGHGATLLHYAGSNGVEIWRQKVPDNLPEIVRLLLDAGADRNATMDVYGGKHTTYFLARSSAHPYDAGIAEALLAVLR